MDESIATAVVDVGGRPYAVIDLPFRGERVGELPLQLVEHALEAFARTAGATLHLRGIRPQRPPPRRGRVQGARAGRCASRANSIRAGDGVASTKGVARVSGPMRRRTTRSRSSTTAPATSSSSSRRSPRSVPRVRIAATPTGSTARMRWSSRASGPRRRRWIACASSGLVEPIRAWIAADRPFLGICLGLQLLFEGSDEDGAETLGVLPGRTVRPRRRARRCRTSAGTRSSAARDAPAVRRDRPATPTSTSSTRYAGVPTADADATPSWPERRTGGRSSRRSRAARFSASSSTPSGAARTACGCWRTSSPSSRTRRRRCRSRAGRGSPPDAPPPGHPLPRRRGRPRREGHPLRRPRRRGRSARARRALRREGADELVFLDITAAPERRGTLLDIVERTARRAFIPLTVGGGVRSVDEMRDVLRAGADKVSLNTAAVADPALIERCAARFGRQAVVVAIDAGADRTPGTEPAAWEVVVAGGREPTGLDAVAWAASAPSTSAPASCSSPRSIATGRGSGFDTELLRAISGRGRVSRSSPRAAPRDRPTSSLRSSTAAPTRSSPPRSSIGGSTRSPRSRRRWPRPGLPVRLVGGRAAA